jgi:hypothetical protein
MPADRSRRSRASAARRAGRRWLRRAGVALGLASRNASGAEIARWFRRRSRSGGGDIEAVQRAGGDRSRSVLLPDPFGPWDSFPDPQPYACVCGWPKSDCWASVTATVGAVFRRVVDGGQGVAFRAGDPDH